MNYLTVQHTPLMLMQTVCIQLRSEVLTAVTKKATNVIVSIFSENFISTKALILVALSDAKHISTDT